MNAPNTPPRVEMTLYALWFGIAKLICLNDGAPKPQDYQWGLPVRIESDNAIVYCFVRNGFPNPDMLLDSLHRYSDENWHIVR